MTSSPPAGPHPGRARSGTWITPPMVNAYRALHPGGGRPQRRSVGPDPGTLVGGLYGVSVGGVFTGESMFHRAPNASKTVAPISE